MAGRTAIDSAAPRRGRCRTRATAATMPRSAPSPASDRSSSSLKAASKNTAVSKPSHDGQKRHCHRGKTRADPPALASPRPPAPTASDRASAVSSSDHAGHHPDRNDGRPMPGALQALLLTLRRGSAESPEAGRRLPCTGDHSPWRRARRALAPSTSRRPLALTRNAARDAAGERRLRRACPQARSRRIGSMTGSRPCWVRLALGTVAAGSGTARRRPACVSVPTAFAQQGFEGTPRSFLPRLPSACDQRCPPLPAGPARRRAACATACRRLCWGASRRGLAGTGPWLIEASPRQRRGRGSQPAGSDRHGCRACPHSGVPTAGGDATGADAASDSDQVEAGERMVNLLHGTAAGEVAEVDHSEAASWKRDGGRLRVVVVARDEHHALTAGLVRGLRASTSAPSVLAALTTRAPATRPATISLDVRPVEVVGSPSRWSRR